MIGTLRAESGEEVLIGSEARWRPIWEGGGRGWRRRSGRGGLGSHFLDKGAVEEIERTLVRIVTHVGDVVG